jgi:hypothetical protein
VGDRHPKFHEDRDTLLDFRCSRRIALICPRQCAQVRSRWPGALSHNAFLAVARIEDYDDRVAVADVCTRYWPCPSTKTLRLFTNWVVVDPR